MKLLIAITLFLILISLYILCNTDSSDKNDKIQTVENYTCDDSWISSSYNCGGCGFNGVGGERICCPSGSESAWGYNYCINLPTGTPCWFDSMCANGDCTGNGYGIQKGTCN